VSDTADDDEPPDDYVTDPVDPDDLPTDDPERTV
jgi:hypothetical protein